MDDLKSLKLEALLERARAKRLIQFNRINGDTVTIQVGRGLYAMTRSSAVAFMQDLLRPRGSGVYFPDVAHSE